MATVTYKKQEAIHKTRGSIPLEGTEHIYRVEGVLWPEAVEIYLQSKFIGTVLHVCPGKSQLGDIRLDLYEEDVDITGDAARLPIADNTFDTVLIDPPYNGKFQWNHDMLNELHRVARKRIIFQHWFSPTDKYGRFKKRHAFVLTEAVIVPTMPKESDLRLAVKTEDGYVIVEEDLNSNKTFKLTDLVRWQPRSYFGRVQLISVMDKIPDLEETAYREDGYKQRVLPSFGRD